MTIVNNDKPDLICHVCGNLFQARRSDAKTCSPAHRKRLSRARKCDIPRQISVTSEPVSVTGNIGTNPDKSAHSLKDNRKEEESRSKGREEGSAVSGMAGSAQRETELVPPAAPELGVASVTLADVDDGISEMASAWWPRYVAHRIAIGQSQTSSLRAADQLIKASRLRYPDDAVAKALRAILHGKYALSGRTLETYCRRHSGRAGWKIVLREMPTVVDASILVGLVRDYPGDAPVRLVLPDGSVVIGRTSLSPIRADELESVLSAAFGSMRRCVRWDDYKVAA